MKGSYIGPFARIGTFISLLVFSSISAAEQNHSALSPVDPEIYTDRSGYKELVVRSSLNGAVIGWGISRAMAGSHVIGHSGMILGLGAGTAIPLLTYRGRPISSGDMLYMSQLQRTGLASGLLLGWILNPRGPKTENQVRKHGSIVAGGGLLGLGLSLVTKGSYQLTPAQGTAIWTAYSYGAISSLLFLHTLDIGESNRGFPATVLGLSNFAALSAFLLRDRFDVDRARFIWTTFGAFGGLVYGACAAWMVGGRVVSTRVIAAGALAGFWGGAAATYLLLPEEGYKSRTDDMRSSLFEMNERGQVSFGVPTPSPFLLAATHTDQGPSIGATITIFEWRASK